MGRISELAGACYHTRNLDFSIYDVDDQRFAVKGRLCDGRAVTTHRFTGEERAPGMFHDLTVFMLVSKAGLIVEDVEVLLDTVPKDDCLKMDESLKPIIGLSVTHGFTQKVKDLVGGREGCTHLVHLISVMAPALMQGYWTIRDSKPVKGDKDALVSLEKRAAHMKNSCYTLRDDGESYGDIVRFIEAEK